MYNKIGVRLIVSLFSVIGYFIALVIIRHISVPAMIYGGIFVFVFTYVINTIINWIMQKKK